MSKILRQDTNGTKPLLHVGELGYDNFPAGGDAGRVWVGTGTENLALSKKVELDAHKSDTSNPHSVTKIQVGLGNVDNTSDLNKPVSTATQTALDGKVDKVGGKGLSTNDYTTTEKSKLAGIEAGAQVNTVASVAGKTGTVALVKGDVGLGNVDNTSDVNKPVSTAQQTALDLKANLVSPAFIGNPTAPTASVGDNDTTIATTAFVHAEIANGTVAKTSITGSAIVPSGTSAQRDSAPLDGYLRFNSTLNIFEGYYNGTWQAVGGGQMFGTAVNKVISYNAQVIAENIVIPAGVNAYSVGDVTIADGYTVTISNGSIYKSL